MATAVSCTSRFSVLKIEDDEDELPNEKKQKQTSSKSHDSQNLNKKKPKKKKSPDEKDNNGESSALSSNKPKKKQEFEHKSSHNKKQISEDQWEEWIKKDNEFVTDAYEQDLQQAILLSKLEYEEKKDFYDSMKSENEQNKGTKNSKKSNKKKDKPATLSLDQFNSLSSTDVENRSKENRIDSPSAKTKSEPNIQNEHFFEDVAADAEKILHKEQRTENYKKLEPLLAQQARSLQFQDEIEKRDKEIERLNSEVETVKAELLTVKTRNKKLCNILAQGEMREKAEILIQVEHLNRIKDELTEQVTELHAALEQERSKVHTLTMEVKKYQSGRKESK